MAIKFERIQPGMTLWSRGRQRQGHTKMFRTAEWPVWVKDVDSAGRRALVSWNSNTPEWWGEYRLKRLFTTRMKTKETP